MVGSGSSCTREASSARPTTDAPGRTARSPSSSRGREGSLATSKSPADDWTRTPLLSDHGFPVAMAAPAFNPRQSSSHHRVLGDDRPRRQRFADGCHEGHLAAARRGPEVLPVLAYLPTQDAPPGFANALICRVAARSVLRFGYAPSCRCADVRPSAHKDARTVLDTAGWAANPGGSPLEMGRHANSTSF